ncbi:glycerate kinase [Paenarthrobacter sp. DKR-5]|uniref:glycerate kinase n=1 Tax=Paenarthrobacter sp. DKR-5 TaxID=2835535 RepID=UPI001BDC57A7|nr:glycerate kinase [Paenarthrobacter sp. DKR-5]MBT1003255.1 glycerate kinase [Paenarthrobacter sp. DKR-5]
MRFLVAPDKFKGSLTAVQAAEAISAGIRAVHEDPEIVVVPVADGGEGTHEVALATGGEERINAVVGAILAPVGARWALHPGTDSGTAAVIETAQASGLAQMDPTPANSLRAHSYGCGQLIAAALDAGATEIILGLGGSAMTDGGTGALRALGLKLLDRAGNLVPLGGGPLAEAVAVDASGLDPRLAAARIRIAVDVTNPLYGPEGAAHIFGPQKGADADAVELLDAGLRNLASLIREATGRDVNVAGAGAAGGFPAGFLGFTEATIERGFDLVAELVHLDDALADADLVITGEGSLDVQSLQGKAPMGVADAANQLGIPVVAVAGRLTLDPAQLAEHGVVASGSIAALAPSEEEGFTHAGRYLQEAVVNALRSLEA